MNVNTSPNDSISPSTNPVTDSMIPVNGDRKVSMPSSMIS